MATQQKKKQQPSNGYPNYQEWFQKLNAQYGDMPVDNIRAAFYRAAPFSSMYTANPIIQNRRVKTISSFPKEHGKDEIVDMLRNPNENERSLREVGNILEYTAYPMQKIRTTYQDLLTYHYYVYPEYVEKEDAKSEAFKREWRLLCKLSKEMQPDREMRKIVGQCLRDGKVFYVPRIDIDKSHNKVRCAFMQQLPQDWVKIAGFNNVSKYTVAFNMFYFLQPGTTIYQFGDLFEPFMDEFLGSLDGNVSVSPKGVVYASRKSIRTEWLKNYKKNAGYGAGAFGQTPDVYNQNGTWFYWVYLPVDKAWTFEIDDVKPNVVSPFTGLYLSMAQIAQYEQVQLEIVQNPLVSMVLGQLETYDAVSPTKADPIKVSPTGRTLFEDLFYSMMQANNTGGIGIFSAPFKDMQLVSLPESPNANSISSAGYEYAMEKSGMSALIPTNSEARAGVAQISLKIESRFAEHMYGQFSRMMDTLIQKLRPNWEWRFMMFGTLADDEQMRKEAKEGMTLGILPATMKYAAMNGMTLLDDMSISNAIMGIDVMSKRLPLVSTYSARADGNNLPPIGGETENPQGGRPSNEGEALTGGGEADIDDATGANEI